MVRPASETTRSAESERWHIPLPYQAPPLTLNRMKGKHWGRFAADILNLNESGHYLAKHYKLPRPIPFPVTVELIWWLGNNSIHDADNIVPTLKHLVDGVRMAGALTDDGPRFVRSATCTVIPLDADPGGDHFARMALVIQRCDQHP
jgi:hypothetical protein